MTAKKITKILILSAWLFHTFLLPTAASADTTCNVEVGGTCTVGNQEIRYMGIDATGQRKFIIKTVNLGTDPRYLDSPFLTDYIAQVYKYAVTVTTVLSTVVIIFAGVLWLTSGGNAAQIDNASTPSATAAASQRRARARPCARASRTASARTAGDELTARAIRTSQSRRPGSTR